MRPTVPPLLPFFLPSSLYPSLPYVSPTSTHARVCLLVSVCIDSSSIVSVLQATCIIPPHVLRPSYLVLNLFLTICIGLPAPPYLCSCPLSMFLCASVCLHCHSLSLSLSISLFLSFSVSLSLSLYLSMSLCLCLCLCLCQYFFPVLEPRDVQCSEKCRVPVYFQGFR